MRLLDAPKTEEVQEYLFSGCGGDEVDCEKRPGNLFGGLQDSLSEVAGALQVH